jgi:type 1 glutamine amidotransferase
MRRALTAVLVATLVGLVAPGAGAQDDTVPHLLVFSGTLGYRHGGIPHMVEVIEHMSELSHAFTAEYTEDVNVLKDPATYDRIDGVVFVQVTGFGGAPFDDAQKAAFLRFFRCGGSFTGVHATSDSSSRGRWDGYHDLIGAQFAAHPHLGSV